MIGDEGTWGDNALVSNSTFSQGSGDITINVDITSSDCSQTEDAVVGYGTDAIDNLSSRNTYGFSNSGTTLFYINGTYSPVDTGFTCTNGVPYHAKFVILQSGGAQVYINNSVTPNASVSGPVLTNQPVYLMTKNNNAHIIFNNYIVTQTGSLSLAAPSFISTGTSTLQVSDSVATGGVSPYTYQWKRSTVSGGPYTNVSGATNLLLNDNNLSSATDYYYVLTANDSSVSLGTSTEIHIKTQPSTISNAVIVGIGDSITNGGNNTGGISPLVPLQNQMLATNHFNSVSTYNHGVSGSATGDWQPGSSNLNSAISDIQNNGANIVTILLDANDAKIAANTSTSTFQTNFSNILTTLQNLGIQHIFVSDPTYINYSLTSGVWTAQSLIDILNYRSITNSFANGSSIQEIGKNPSLYVTTQNYPTTYILSDGAHLTTAGVNLVGDEWARDIDNILNPATISFTTPTSGSIVSGTSTALTVSTTGNVAGGSIHA